MLEMLEKEENAPVSSPDPYEVFLDARAIMALIPHRPPFVLIDRVTRHIPGKLIEGYKNVTINEPHFAGHFPGNPIMPGVLILESMAQTGAILVALMPEGKGKLALFSGIEHFRFRRPVLPGDQLRLRGELVKLRSGLGKALVCAMVNDVVVAEGEVMFSLVPHDCPAQR